MGVPDQPLRDEEVFGDLLISLQHRWRNVSLGGEETTQVTQLGGTAGIGPWFLVSSVITPPPTAPHKTGILFQVLRAVPCGL